MQLPWSRMSIGLSFLVGALLLITHPAFAAGPRADYVEIASWETGYQAQYTVANDGPGTMSSWTVAFDLPTSNTISSSWDSALTRSGQHLVFNNAAWNGDLPPGASITFGFVVVGTTRPTNCTINGGPCDTLPALTEHVRRGAQPGPGDRVDPRRDRSALSCTDPRYRRSWSVRSRRWSRARRTARSRPSPAL
jgi:cellulose binding protein with CBM2 domain